MFSTLDDREIDGLLSGEPTANADLAPLVAIVATLRRSVGEVVPTMSDGLRGQLRATTVVPITAREAGRGALYKVGAVAAAAAVVVGLGVGASQNRLPSGLQDVLSSTADIVGIHVPAASERGNSDAHDEPEERGSSNRNDDGVPGGGNDNTNGGATPAEPGTSGDHAPATPATPPEQSNGTPGANTGGTPSESGDRGSDSIGGPTPPPQVTTPEPSIPTSEPPPPAEPVEEPPGPGNANPNANPNANANGLEHGIGATGAQSNGTGPGGDNGGGRPETTYRTAGQGPPADVLPNA